jgi:4-aminobutyrate aminotransferase
VAKPESFAAVFVEPIQGEGGYVVPPDDFLPQLRELTSRHGILLVVDEIQTGMGRTGRLFACEHGEVVVDIVTLAKGIASGLPLGAIVARADLMSWPPGAHGSTFGGNPVSCAAALATLDLLEGGLITNARARGEQMRSGLERFRGAHPGLLIDVRGLMLAVDCASPAVANELMLECFQRGLLTLSAGERALRFSPPLTLSEEEAIVALEILEEACRALDVRRTRR